MCAVKNSVLSCPSLYLSFSICPCVFDRVSVEHGVLQVIKGPQVYREQLVRLVVLESTEEMGILALQGQQEQLDQEEKE